jgi:hypothetical protein
MASESNPQPSSPESPSAIMNSNENQPEIPPKNKYRNVWRRVFGKLRATPFIYTDELKQYSVNGSNVKQ